ncbi:MAG: DUF4124 domain-containing protein [bacterium]
MRSAIALITSLTLLGLTGSGNAAKLYKWVAEDGSIYYSDKVPPEDITKAHSQFSSTGVKIESRGAAKTPEEIQRERQQEALRKEQERLLEEQRAKDNALLKTFRSVDDIILARNGKLATYDTQIQMTHKNIETLKARLLMLQQRAAGYERQGKPVDAKLVKSLDNAHAEIQDSYSSILRREKDKEIIYKEYDDNITRFRQLKNLKEEAIQEAKASGKTAGEIIDFSLVETAITCDSEAQCNTLWKAARNYGLKFATTSTQLDAENIFLSKPPTEINDISVTVSRVRPRKGEKDVIFLDIKCKPTISGIEFCQGPVVEKIRKGFRPAVLGEKS